MLHLKVKSLLKSHSLTVTKNRSKVLSYFLKINKPIELKTINLEFNSFDRVTLFRVLNTFEKSKLIHNIILDNGKKFFALCNRECSKLGSHSHNHIHFICEKCDDVSCLDIKNFPKLSAPNYVFKDVNINASGLCSNCN